ncbi:putative general porin [Alteromonadaceae bacterium 2753L.S.0a.02]|nr:putative general porin [Alteromonadaceae bacterium 2753L.S.0a.02]
MKYQKSLILISLVISAAVNAEEYQVFGSASYTKYEEDNFDSLSSYEIDGVYFFDKKQTLGPLSEFSLINTVSYVLAGYGQSDDGDNKSAFIGGKWIGSHLGLGAVANYSDNNGDSGYDSATLTGEYLFSDKLLARINYHDYDETYPGWEDSNFSADIVYDHSLNTTDYIGFKLSYEESRSGGDDSVSLTSKYYNDFSNGQYLTATGRITKADENTVWNLGGTYYFSKMTGLLLDFTSVDSDDLGTTQYASTALTHYFTPNFYGMVRYTDYSYSSKLNRGDAYRYGLELGLQY